MLYEYRITRIPVGNNTKAEQDLNEFGKQGFHVVAWASFNMDVILVLQREPKAEVAKTSDKRQVTVKLPEE